VTESTSEVKNSDTPSRSADPTYHPDVLSVQLNQILTRSGRRVSILEPKTEEIDIDDIAWGLSSICRYSGHTSQFYSVAQHSVFVSLMVPQEGDLPLWGLLHDAAEAYIGDVVAPLKILLPRYRNIEDNLERTIYESFGLFGPRPAIVKETDLRMLATEIPQVMGNHSDFKVPYQPFNGIQIKEMTRHQDFHIFKARYLELIDAR